MIFKKRNFIFSRKKSSFFGFFNQNFEIEKFDQKLKNTHFWLDPASDVTKTVQNYKKTNKKVDFESFYRRVFFTAKNKYYGESSYVISVQDEFFPAKKILRWITLCEKCPSLRFFLPKILRFDLRYVRSVQADIFSCQKKTSIYAVSPTDYFFLPKNAGFSAFQTLVRHTTSLHVTCSTDKYCF